MVCAQHQIRSFCFRNGAPLHGQTAAIFLRKTRYVVRIRVSTSQVARADCLERWRIFLCFPLLFFSFLKTARIEKISTYLWFSLFFFWSHTHWVTSFSFDRKQVATRMVTAPRITTISPVSTRFLFEPSFDVTTCYQKLRLIHRWIFWSVSGMSVLPFCIQHDSFSRKRMN